MMRLFIPLLLILCAMPAFGADLTGLAAKLSDVNARLLELAIKHGVEPATASPGETVAQMRETYRILRRQAVAIEKALGVDAPAEMDLPAENGAELKRLREKVRHLKGRVSALETWRPQAKPFGVGPYLAPGEEPGKLTWWVDQSADRGAGILRIIPLASSWTDGLTHPFLRSETGKYDITRLDGTWVTNLRAGLDRARAKGVKILIDIFDEVGTEAQDRQDRHPFNGRNNIHSDAPVPGVAYSTTDPGRAKSFKQQVEHALKRDWEGPAQTFHLVLKEYTLRLVEALAGYEDVVILCVGNETESRSVETVVYAWLDAAGWAGERCINGTYLYSGEPGAQLLADGQKRALFAQSAYLRVHHIRADSAAALIANLKIVLETYPHLKLILDSDGAGSGSVRGEHNRPTLAAEAATSRNVVALAGKWFGYWVSKILGDADGIAMLDSIALAWR